MGPSNPSRWRCPELDVASQGGTVEEAKANLVEAVELFLKTASASEVESRLHGEVFVTRMEVTVAKIAATVWLSRVLDPRETGLCRSESARKSRCHAVGLPDSGLRAAACSTCQDRSKS